MGDRLFYKVGVKIFDDTNNSDGTDQIANGISTYQQLNVLEHATSLTAFSSLTLAAISLAAHLLF